MNRNRQTLKYLSLTLCALLAVNSPAVMESGVFGGMAAIYAKEADRTYEEFRSGKDAGKPAAESSYTTIHISSEEDLTAFAESCQLDSWSLDKYVVLDGDIVLSAGFDRVIPGFGGVFDGGGHKISNLRIEAAGSDQGLFRYVREGAEVRNLTVSGRVQPAGSQSRVGILAGVNYGRIINCSVSGIVTGDEGVGGIVGVNEASGEIRQCSSAAVVTGSHKAGGICGENKGTLNNCSNSGNINTHSKEVTYDLDDISVENLENLNSMSNIAAHTDTGGIAGCSEGKIYYCSNTGTVGYQHVGYNTGGIAGRLHQGYVQNCTNDGQIYGRKDVGGIVGQMEPFLELRYLSDKLHEIDRETDRLIELMDQTGEGIRQCSDEAFELTGSITASLRNISAAGGYLTGTANFLWYIYNQELAGINTDLQRLNGDLKDQAEAGGTKDVTIDLGDSVSGGDLGEITVKVPDHTEGYRAALRRFGESATGHVGNMINVTAERNKGVTENLDLLNREMQSVTDNLFRLSEVLEAGADRTGADVDAVSAQAKVLRRSISELRDDLFRYEGISVTVADASDEAAGSSSGAPGALPEDDAAQENPGKEGNSSGQEEIIYDTSTFQQGKITLCVNRGKVEADTNVGGIAGQIATEYDFDPEDDITLSGEESFNIEQTIKAVVRESRNEGQILGKKDCVGGIVGKADFGAVISCESYGKVSSSGGSYVGGIAGVSSYAVRSCYFLGELSGKNYVGGIAGKGCDIFYSYACPALELTGECGGSVAGILSEEGILAGNYYVEGKLPGVDSVGYEGGAAPLAYDDFCNMEGVPEEFREFNIQYVAEGKVLAEVTYRYDELPDLSGISQTPPEKEGYYGIWPEADFESVRGSVVLEAQYIPWVSSLSSAEADEESGKPLVLVQGRFLPGAEIQLNTMSEGKGLVVKNGDARGLAAEEYSGPLTVRAYAENPKASAVELYDGGAWRAVESTVVGSYLEFQAESSCTFKVATVQKDNTLQIVIVSIAAAGAAVILIIVVTVKLAKKRKARRGRQDEGRQERDKKDGAREEKRGQGGNL